MWLASPPGRTGSQTAAATVLTYGGAWDSSGVLWISIGILNCLFLDFPPFYFETIENSRRGSYLKGFWYLLSPFVLVTIGGMTQAAAPTSPTSAPGIPYKKGKWHCPKLRIFSLSLQILLYSWPIKKPTRPASKSTFLCKLIFIFILSNFQYGGCF